MDDLPAKDLPEQEPDREAAAELAEMATELAGAAAPAAAEGLNGVAPEPPDDRPRRLWQMLDPRRWSNPRRWSLTRPRPRLPSRTSVRSWARTRRFRQGATALALAAALALGFSGSVLPPRGSVPSPSGRPIAASGRTVAPTSPALSPGHGSPAHSPGASASDPNPTATPFGTGSPSHESPSAKITFRELVLDSSVDSTGTARSFSFVSDGVGTVSAEVVQASPMDSTKLCVTMDEARPVCTSGATPGFTQRSTTAHSRWTVTLASSNKSSPTVDVAFSWPTDHPSITLTHGRFQGSPNPDSIRTLTADFTTRVAGKMSVEAAWSRIVGTATLTLTDVSGSKPVTLDTINYQGRSAISPSYTRTLTGAKAYEMTLFNGSPDTGRTVLTATIAFP